VNSRCIESLSLNHAAARCGDGIAKARVFADGRVP
jgi:hypothetical protein